MLPGALRAGVNISPSGRGEFLFYQERLIEVLWTLLGKAGSRGSRGDALTSPGVHMEFPAYDVQEQENGLRILSDGVGPGRAPAEEVRKVIGILLMPPSGWKKTSGRAPVSSVFPCRCQVPYFPLQGTQVLLT